ncbi:ribonuclease P protein subunit [Candidatus Woesearchaeota archaeon]|nr:ribonuclease P protein subunit [Candidatus Woesearchaeota archaeon]
MLIGKEIEIISSTNPNIQTGKNMVLDETKFTLKVRGADQKIRTLLKNAITFRVGSQILSGVKITKRPEDKT